MTSFPFPACNLWTAETGSVQHLNAKARNVTARELRAYFDWLRRRANLPDLGEMTFEGVGYVHGAATGPLDTKATCKGATFGERLQHSRYVNGEHLPEEWAEGCYSIPMPGYQRQPARVTMETLDEAGEVIASQTLPVEPKKGGVIWSRDDVRKACGKVAKPSKRQSAPLSPAEPVTAVMAGVEPETAPLVAEAAPSASIAADPTPTSDVPDILQRLAALEARVEALSVVTSPTAAQRERSPAHERAVRRAWAERIKARNRLRNLRAAEESNHAEYRAWKEARAQLEKERDQARGDAAAWEKSSGMHFREVQQLGTLRDKATPRARRMVNRARRNTAAQRQLADALQAQLTKLRIDMADPHQPERASDITRLMRERDEARTALSAVTARAERSEAAVHQVADKLEEMASRVARAEAALRARAA